MYSPRVNWAPPSSSPNGPQALFRAITQGANSTGFGIVIVSQSSGYELLYLNNAAAKVLGAERDQLLGTHLASYLNSEALTSIDSLLNNWTEGLPLPAVTRMALQLNKSSRSFSEVAPPAASDNYQKEIRLVDCSWQPLMEYEGEPAMVGFFYDITHHEALAADLRRSEKRFRGVVDGAPDGVLIMREGFVLFANEAAHRLVGSNMERSNAPISMADFLHPDDIGRAFARQRAILQNQQIPTSPAEYRIRRLDGQELTLEVSSIVIDFDSLPAVMSFARDITERKIFTDKLLQADRLSAMGLVAASVAHEINNPLSYVMLNLSYLQRQFQKGSIANISPERAQEHIREALDGVKRVQAIIQDLKNFSRPSDDSSGAVELHAVLDAAQGLAMHELGQRALVRKNYSAVPLVRGDAQRLEQVFVNLLMNASHAIEERWHQSTEAFDVGEVTISCFVEENAEASVIIEVSDNGQGIPDEALSRVFDPFFTTKSRDIGTGLGLPICKGIIESYGGELSLKSETGKGTCVRVKLCAATENDEKAAPLSSRIPPPSRPPYRGKLIIIDDEVAVGEMLRCILEEFHDVTVYKRAKPALEELRSNPPPDVIFCDLMMPEMSGMEFFEQLCFEFPDLKSRVIFMTGGTFLPRIGEFLEVVPNETLDKPFDAEHLMKKLNRLLLQQAQAKNKTRGVS